MEAAVDHYAVLGVSPTASSADLRAAYTAAALAAHPDKAGGDAEAFQAVQRAWEALREPAAREAYDEELAAARRRGDAAAALPVAEEVPLDEMEPYGAESAGEPAEDGEPAPAGYVHHCRCGGGYVLTAGEAAARADIVPCSSCSLRIRVLYSH